MDVGSLSGLEQLLAGGDGLLPDRVSRAMRALPGVKLVNGYGPTEATTFSCCFDATSGVPFDDSVPIGRPVANSSAYVLDRELQPTPVGVPGELYIGGDGVARGYLNQPELTAERFVRSPFGEGRLYRTGDMVRWRPDGYLEFLGRQDLQVKVRGFRVEPGEVEATLIGHPGVRDAAVVAPADRQGDRRMVAYVVADPGLGEAELRSHLAEKLPRYMVPSATPASKASLTPNGKWTARPSRTRPRGESARRRGLWSRLRHRQTRRGHRSRASSPASGQRCSAWDRRPRGRLLCLGRTFPAGDEADR